MFNLFLAFGGALVLSWLFTFLVKKIAERFGILDYPRSERKIHKQPTPLLGGVAIFLGLFLVLFLFVIFAPQSLVGHYLSLKQLAGLFVGSLILIIGGVLDEKYNLKPSRQIIFSVLAVLAIIFFGVGVREITNPFGGIINLVFWEKTIFWWQGVGYRLTLPADLLTFVWLMIMIYTTKFLDGLDGLVSGITVIGALAIVFLTTLTKWYQPEVGLVSAIAAGAFAGFLIWNWHPAKIFLGNSGSTLAGFLLGSLAIISGGKIATTLLVLGAPVLDVAWVITRRMFWEKKSPALGDRKHLHFRLLDIGFSHRGAVLFLWSISIFFGVLAIFLQSKEKLIALSALFAVIIILAIFLIKKGRQNFL